MLPVLVIDDDPALISLMMSAFSRQGFETYSAANGCIGTRLFDAYHPRLVVTDIVMPEKEGIETIMDLKRSVDPPKVIAISGGRVGCHYLRWAKELGADEVMLKPFPMAALVAAGCRLLGVPDHAPASDQPHAMDNQQAGRPAPEKREDNR